MDKIEKVETKAVEVFQARLDELPGWSTLDQKTQGVLYEVKQNMFHRHRLRMLGEFGDLMDLHRVEEALEGTEVRMLDFMRDIYPGVDLSTIKRKLQAFRQLVSVVPRKALESTVTLDSSVLSNFERIAKASPGRLLTAAKELPPIPVQDAPQAAKYLEALDLKLQENRSQSAHKGKNLMDPREAAMMAANAVIHYDRAASFKTSSQRIGFAKQLMGWYLEATGVPAKIVAQRNPPLPDAVGRAVGRPRMTQDEKEQARKSRMRAKRRKSIKRAK